MKKALCGLGVVLLLALGIGCDNLLKSLFQKGKEAATSPVAPQVTPQVPVASEAAGLIPIGGIYSVQGTNPGGAGQYVGTAKITTLGGDDYNMEWSVGTAYSGRGKRTANTLSVVWGDQQAPIGKVDYIIEADGTLRGTWFAYQNPGSLGTETLTPQR